VLGTKRISKEYYEEYFGDMKTGILVEKFTPPDYTRHVFMLTAVRITCYVRNSLRTKCREQRGTDFMFNTLFRKFSGFRDNEKVTYAWPCHSSGG
jgi:hypothetical protein